ncbi:MAG: hypothetical protein ABFD96_18140 [Armatimonadia bacterium]
MTTKLSLHWRPTHLDGADQTIIGRWRPNSAKIINANADHVRAIRQVSPGALIVLRDHPLSEQHDNMMHDPAATGEYHAARMVEIAQSVGADPANTVLLGINEPHVWEEGGITATVVYTCEFLDKLSAMGWRGGALNLSVGWPANTGFNTPPDWVPYYPVYEAIRCGGHVLMLHEYWAKEGPQNNWGWWAGRYTQCPWDVPIIMGECGVDQGVNGPMNVESRGWASHMNAETYFAQLRWYDQKLALDPRVHSAQVFCYDYDSPWQTFDIRQVRDQWVQTVESWGRGDCSPLYESGLPFDDEPVEDEPEFLPEHEPGTDAPTLAEKVRWWLEEYTRQLEASNDGRAEDILYSLIKRDDGLLYRLENTLKGIA